MNFAAALPFQIAPAVMGDAVRADLECPRGPFVVPALSAPGPRLSLIVPAYQEAENIGQLLVDVCAVLDRFASLRYEVIVVDDNSPDGTWRIACQMAVIFPAVRVIRRTGEKGLASSVIRGYQAATGEILGTINADLQHPPSVLGSLLESIAGADVAVASRFCQGASTGEWPQERLWLSRAAYRAGKLMLPKIFSSLTDPLSGFYLLRRRIIEGVPLDPIGFKTLIEILAKGRAASVAECPYRMEPRRKGESKATIPSSLSYLLQLKRLHCNYGE
jgi:dolichol-phosphate mannosyltransferase